MRMMGFMICFTALMSCDTTEMPSRDASWLNPFVQTDEPVVRNVPSGALNLWNTVGSAVIIVGILTMMDFSEDENLYPGP